MTEQKREKIMLVDDNKATLNIGKNMLIDYYEVFTLPSAFKLFEYLARVTPDLILMDVEMPEMNGYEAIALLKANDAYADIPVIFVTSLSKESDELKGLELGAIDYVAKPFSAALLLKRIENHLMIQEQKKKLKHFNENLQEIVRERVAEVQGLQSAILSTVAELVEFRDNVTGEHVSRTQRYMELMVEKLIDEGIYIDEVSAWDMDFLLPSAQLHDVGKIAISDAILNKPGRLTPEEFEIMKTHTTKGVEAIKRMEKKSRGSMFLRHAETIAGTHHEKWDGSGYPSGLKRWEIPLEGRIMAVADVYDALISIRPYKDPISADNANRIIGESAGTHFDPILVQIFEKLSGEFANIAKNYNTDYEN